MKKFYEKPAIREIVLATEFVILAGSSLPNEPSPGDTPWGEE